jgi:hypothetical protein
LSQRPSMGGKYLIIKEVEARGVEPLS